MYCGDPITNPVAVLGTSTSVTLEQALRLARQPLAELSGRGQGVLALDTRASCG